MCMSCGCREANENHGDRRHITMDTLKTAADAAGTSVEQVVKNIQQTFEEGRVAAGPYGEGEPGRTL